MAQEHRKLSVFAKAYGLTYATAHRHWKQGQIDGIQLPSGTILVTDWKQDGQKIENDELAVIYSRVATPKQREKLKAQTIALTNYAHSKGYTVVDTVEEVAPAYSDRRTKLLGLLYRQDWNVIIVENPGSIARFGLPFIDTLLQQTGRSIVYAEADDEQQVPSEEHFSDAEHELNTLIVKSQEVLGKLLGYNNEKQMIKKAITTLLG